ncbi:MAG: hypothetical protein M0Z96_01895, partial [Actinomycetota bacterium]|nr:hypothetical protein [Actinomycetota bacterium]
AVCANKVQPNIPEPAFTVTAAPTTLELGPLDIRGLSHRLGYLWPQKLWLTGSWLHILTSGER